MFPALPAELWTNVVLVAQAANGKEPGMLVPSASPWIDGPSLALAIGGVALVLLAAMLVSILWSSRQARQLNSPRRLLSQLCLAHGFGKRQERLLLKASRALGVQQPARFFLEPELVRQAAGHPALHSRRAELAQLSADLF